MPILWRSVRQKVCFVFSVAPDPVIHSPTVIYSHDTSISATRARNSIFHPLEHGEKDLRLLHAPQHPSKRVTSVSRRVYHAMALIPFPAKCNQRKIHCTFVKFYRQTAPAGPGHNPPEPKVLSSITSTSSVSSSRHSSFSTSHDDYIAPSPLTVPSMTENLFSSAFLFPPMYPDNAHTELVPAGEPSDLSSRYRSRSDLLKQTGEQVRISVTSSHPFSHSRHGWGGSTAGTYAHQHLLEKTRRHHQQLRPYPPSDISTVYHRSMQRPKPKFDLDVNFSDGSSTSSIPSSSAASSEVHLPLPSAAQTTGAFISSGAAFSQHPLADSTPSSFHPQPPFHPSSTILHPTSTPAPASAAPIPKPNEPFDESSFGALSLDDPGLSLTTDVSPFFSDVLSGSTVLHDPDATPMPPRPAEGAGDAELWRAFMRSTPLGEQPDSHSHSQHHQNRRASITTPNIGHHYSSAHPQQETLTSKRPNTLHSPFHQPPSVSHAAPSQTQQPDDDLSRYRKAIATRARETETVLQPPPDARSKIQFQVPSRQGVVNVCSESLGQQPELLPILRSGLVDSVYARRRGSLRRPGSSGSEVSVSLGVEVGAGVDSKRDRDREGKGVKRGLSGGVQGEPESKRRVVGVEKKGKAG
ncbi:hypothetical protein C0995_010807 [Termitomyces sp. Mi166|nr:hypothetical protein C0995_010807 [Termitomyces sp. Mi166\